LELLGEVIVPAMGSSVRCVVLFLIFVCAAGLSSGKTAGVPGDFVRLTTVDRESRSAGESAAQIDGLAQYYNRVRVSPQKSDGLDPAILLGLSLCCSPFVVYLYKRSRHWICAGCGSYAPNPSQVCDSCRARFEAEEIGQRAEEQQAETARQRRLQEEERGQKPRSLEDLQSLSGDAFKRLIASLFIRDGYKVSRRRGYGEFDMVLQMSGSNDVVQNIRCKTNIGPPVIREFYKSMTQAEARHGFVVTNAAFTHSAREFADGKPITLIDGHYLLAWISWTASDRETAGAVQSDREFNPYEVLGVSPGASNDEIRSAYRGLVVRYHPDKVAHLGDEFEAIARERAVAINRAFAMLNRS
jgi:Restriction endonuclease/DnaJ domain